MTATDPTPLSAADLDTIAARADAAAPAAWEVVPHTCDCWADVPRLVAEVRRLTAAPATYALPPEPPPEVTELWDRDGLHWHRVAARTWSRSAVGRDPWWQRWNWLRLLDKRGRLSTTPPTATEEATTDEH
jgi:hypothetical protein